ncbi:MAG TPA: hypothetical protein VMM56_17070, partial [Planctomycetaceae bacterium]|nr:hypothetical protein [Planctomycetaceae bacterium]
PDSFSHPALSQLVSASQTDFGKAVVSTYWQLEAHPTLSGVRIGAALDGGDPFLVEQSVGDGLVAFSAVSFDQKGSNLPSLFAFLPFLHELTYHLASPTLIDLNRNASSVLSVSLPQVKSSAGADDTESITSADVTLPDGTTRKATFKRDSQRTSLELTRAVQPGIHRVELPEELAVQLAGLTMYEEGKSYLPFAILNDAGESRLDPMTAEQEAPANRYLDYFHSENFEQLVAAVIGDVPGFELWKFLAIGAVLLVLAESFVTRWIAQRRKLGTTEAVSFVSEGEKLSTFQQRAKELLESVRTK